MHPEHSSRSPGLGDSLRAVFPIFLLVRVLLMLWLWGVRQLFPQPLPPHPTLRQYLGVEPQFNAWLEPWQRWDTLHYQAIAERGYRAFDGALARSPLYPALMRLVGELAGGNTLLGGILVSNLAYLGAMVAFHQIALRELGSARPAQRAALYLAVFPTAFFFLAAYTESLLLLGTTVALLAAWRHKWIVSGVAAAGASLSRLVGVTIAVPLGYLGLQGWRERRNWRAWVPLLAALAGAAVLPVYAWLVLDLSPLAPLRAQAETFRVSAAFPGLNLLLAAGRLAAGGGNVSDALDLVFLVLFTVCGVIVWRRYSRTLGLLYVSGLVPLLMRMATVAPLHSSARFVLALFPAFMLLAEWGANPWRHRLILYGSTAGLLYLSGQFAIWGWAA